MYHYARLIELVYSIEKLVEIVKDDEIRSDDVRTKPQGSPRNATAHIEAPRGVLIHDYGVDCERHRHQREPHRRHTAEHLLDQRYDRLCLQPTISTSRMTC